MPFKVWALGEEVLAVDFNDYVQEQVIATFANAAARDAAILVPTVGQTVRLADTGALLTYHGPTAGWRPPWNSKWGHVGTPKSVSTAQGPITAEVDVTGSSFTFTAVANRIYKHTVRAIVAHDTANAAIVLKITDGSNTELDRAANHTSAVTSNDTLEWSWLELGLTAGSKTRKVRAQAGSGAMSIQSDDADFQYSIEDDGPNGNPS